MPIYIYEHPETQERKEIVQRMLEPHEYEENGVKWSRIFESPQANTSPLSSIDPFSRTDFIEKTGKSTGTLGGLWDLSAELAEKRKKVCGNDPVKDKTTSDYKKKCGGKDHPNADPNASGLSKLLHPGKKD